jgi:membrane-bound lytic murein transglycosylase A
MLLPRELDMIAAGKNNRLHDYGIPFFIEANLATENANRVSPVHRLMIAQDTGSAIVGPARADLYWGAGDHAARIANRIHNPGRFVMLLPRAAVSAYRVSVHALASPM